MSDSDQVVVPESGDHRVRGENGVEYRLTAPFGEGIVQRIADRRIEYLGPAEDDAPPPLTRPALNASRAEWIAYAVALGLPEADAEVLKREDLIEGRYVLPGNR